jgi:hypothetical protein
MARNMVSGKPSNQSARQVDIPPTTRFYVMFTRTEVWEYVLQGRQKYGFCSRATDVCPAHIGCAYCGKTNLNYTGSSTRVHISGLWRASNGINLGPVG